MSPEALTWIRGQAVAERKSVGSRVSELIYEYRNELKRTSARPLPRARYTDAHESIVAFEISITMCGNG